VNLDPAPFRPVMLAHALEPEDFAPSTRPILSPNGNGTAFGAGRQRSRRARPHADAALFAQRRRHHGKFSRPVAVIASPRFFKLEHDASRKSLHTFRHHASFAIDGELLVVREGRVQSFNVLQQRLNRKVISPKLTKTIRFIACL